MDKKFFAILVVLALANLFCGSTPTPTSPPPQTQPATEDQSVPSGHNEEQINGSNGTGSDGIPVDCGGQADGNVNIPAGSFSGSTLIEIDCLSTSEKNSLDLAVENATGQTGEVLGAIKLNPAGMKFNSFVTITIPLLRRVAESEGDIMDVYVFQDGSTTIFETLQASVGSDCNRWCARASVDHFTTFVAFRVTGTPQTITCTDPLGCATYANGEPVRIASLLAFSSKDPESRAVAVDNEAGILGAIKDYGDIAGHPIEYQSYDEACEVEQALSSAKQIVDDPSIAGVIGTTCSGTAGPVMDYISGAGYTMISPANTSSFLATGEVNFDGYFRVAPSDLQEARAMAIYAYNDLEARYVSVVYEGDPPSLKRQLEIFVDTFSSLGGKVLNVDEFQDPAFYAEMLKVRLAAGEQTPDAIYIPMISRGAVAVNLLSEFFGDKVFLLGHSTMYNHDFVDSAGKGAYFIRYPRVMPNYRDQAGDYGYDAAGLLFEALRSLAQLDTDGTLYIGRQALRDALRGMNNFPGRTGTLTCNRFGDCAAPVGVEIYTYDFSNKFIYNTTLFP